MSQPTLAELVDVPDLEDALRHDEDGSLQANITSYFDHWKSTFQQTMDAGLPREEFDRVNTSFRSIESAEKIINFFAKVKP